MAARLRLPFSRDARRRPRRAPRADGPRTLLPESELPGPPALRDRPDGELTARLDAARSRLRQAIPPQPAEDR
jgi:hypothetical protein